MDQKQKNSIEALLQEAYRLEVMQYTNCIDSREQARNAALKIMDNTVVRNSSRAVNQGV